MKHLLLSLALTLPIVAESPAHEQRRVQGYVNKWQSRMSMSDWTVVMQVLPQDQIGTALAGWSHTDAEYKLGLMLVCRRKDYPALKRRDLRREQENTVVHELIHMLLYYQFIYPWANESVTISIAEALVPTP